MQICSKTMTTANWIRCIVYSRISSLHTGYFSCFCGRLLSYFLFFFPNVSFRNTIRVSNSLSPDQDRHEVGPDLGPNFLKVYKQTTKFTPSKKIVQDKTRRVLILKTYKCWGLNAHNRIMIPINAKRGCTFISYVTFIACRFMCIKI